MKNWIKISAVMVFTFGIMSSAIAQEKVDARLLAKFTKTELTQMEQDKPGELQFWTFYLDNGYSIQDMPKGKGADLPVISIKDITEFNVLALKEGPQIQGNRYFRVKQTGKLFALHSIQEVKAKMKK